jgi:dTMP kinase
LFVVLEGIDGCGKSELCELLANKLDAELFTFPDYGTPSGRLILRHLRGEWAVSLRNKDFKGDDVGPLCESHTNAMVFQSLQFTNRMELQVPIGLCLAENRDVVGDRYIGSGIVYGAVDGLDSEWLFRTQKHLIQPDVNILVDVDLEDSIKRRPERRDRYEENLEFMLRVSEVYREVWNKMSTATTNLKEDTLWAMVDGRGSVEETYEDIFDIVSRARRFKGTAQMQKE